MDEACTPPSGAHRKGSPGLDGGSNLWPRKMTKAVTPNVKIPTKQLPGFTQYTYEVFRSSYMLMALNMSFLYFHLILV